MKIHIKCLENWNVRNVTSDWGFQRRNFGGGRSSRMNKLRLGTVLVPVIPATKDVR
jgi:hypothetical protein